jgi:hypothetical protein
MSDPLVSLLSGPEEGMLDNIADLGSSFVPTGYPADAGPHRDPEVGRQLGEEIIDDIAHISASEARAIMKVRRFDAEESWGDQGANSASHWLRWRAGMCRSTAGEWVRIGRALERLPKTRDAYHRGVLTYTQVRAITRIATPENEATLIQYARYATGSQLVVICREVKRHMASLEHPDFEDVLRLVFRMQDDGSEEMTARMRPEHAATIRQAIEVEQREARSVEAAPGGEAAPDAPDAPGAPDAPDAPDAPVPPTPGRRDPAADVYSLVRICERYIDLVRTNKKVSALDAFVAVDLQTLRNTDGSVVWRAELHDGTQLTPETARRLTCDCALVPVILKPDGTPIDVGRRTRVVPTALARALRLRDRHCTYPGCESRATDAHHIRHWAQGGETSLDNLTLLCERHHTRVHEGGYRILCGKDGSRIFIDPSGEVVPRSDLREVPEDVREILRARNSAAGIVVDASKVSSERGSSYRPDLGGCIGAVLDRTIGSRFYFEPRHGRAESEVA